MQFWTTINTKPSRITSYINNLHPVTHKALYSIIEKVLALTIPLWNQTLTPLKTPCRYRRIQYSGCDYDPDPETIPKDQQPKHLPDESEEDFWDRRESWARSMRRVVRPEPGEFQPPTSLDYLGQKLKFLDESGGLKEEHQVDPIERLR